MPGRRRKQEERLDELYREHPEGFVAGRDALAKELRAAGEREEADRVGKLRRPTIPAWVINRAALSSPSELEEFAAASNELGEAQTRALEGDEKGADAYRAAAAREREATEAVLDVARSGARDVGHPPSARVLELVSETLRAASGNAELRERVVGGRLERQQSAATLGTPDARPRGRRPGTEKRREVETARRELQRLEAELADATEREERLRTRIDQATEALNREKANLAASEKETSELRRQVKAARRHAGSSS